MKKISLILLFVFAYFSGMQAQTTKTIDLKPNRSTIKVSSVTDSGLLLNSSFDQLKLEPVVKKDDIFYRLKVKGLVKTFNAGMPEIPVISKLIEVPLDANVEFEIVSYDEEIIDLNDYGIQAKIYPAQESLSKSEKEKDLKIKQNVYNKDEFLYQETAKYYNSGIMRGVRLGRIEIYPIQYNPAKNILKVLNNLVVKVKFVNADLQKTQELKKKTYSPVFGSLLSTSVINHKESKELITQSPLHYVIVSDRMFEYQLAPFIEWKEKKGFEVTVGYTDEIGTSKEAIKSWLQNIYESENPMSYVLFVGDIQQIPSWPGDTENHVTDLKYCEYTGDYLPEVYYGRFSATNPTELQPQLDKTLMYEKYLMPDPSYLNEVFLVAGDDESYEDNWGNGQINYGTEYYFNADNNISSHVFLQDPPMGNSAVHDSIIANVNTGLAFANYTAHCSSNGWAEPSFSINDVNGLNNEGKYGVWIGNCCLSNKFDENVCFGEAALRKNNGGAIGYIGGSNSTLWDEDYWWGVGVTSSIDANPTYEDSGRGAYDGMFHTMPNEADDTNTWYAAQGQIQVCGNLAVEASTSNKKEYYWEIYHLMGDPSVINYIGVPQQMNVTLSPSALLMGMSSLTVNSAPYAYVALSQDGELIATAMSDNAGNATLEFDGSAINVGNADLVVTAQNRQPYISTVLVSPADQAYIVLNSFTTSDDPNYNSTIDLNVALENVAETGSGYDADDVVATISSTDPYVTINDNTENYGTIVAGNTVTVDSAFSITIADNVPDQHVISLDMVIVDAANETFNAVINVVANAPEITISDLMVTNDDDGSGILDPGETGDIKFAITNSGHADADYTGTLSIVNDPDNYLTLGNNIVSGISLATGETQEFVFAGASADANTPLGSTVGLQLDVTAGENNQYTSTSNQDIIIGIIPIYPISVGGALSVCTGTFYDSGLDTGEYGNGEDYTMTFLPPEGEEFIIVDFSAFEVEGNYDFLHVYLGPDTNSPEMEGSPFTGANGPGRIESTNGITFRFTSDSMVTAAGWIAEVSCFTPTTIPECATNPVPADQASNVFPLQVSWDAVLGASSYDVYFGTDADPMNNTPVTVNNNFFDVNTEANTTYYWTVLPTNSIGTTPACDTWTFTTGNAQILMTNGTVTTSDAMFYDEGGPNADYSNSLDQTLTFYPSTKGNMISANFLLFDVELGSNGTQYDYLEVYDGADTSAPLIGKFSADDGAPVPTELQPVTATNTEGALTFVFHSDGSVTREGWEAEITAVTPDAIDENFASQLQIYPNPNKGSFVINAPEQNNNNYEVMIYSVGGKQVYHRHFENELMNIQLNEYTKGLYFVKVISGKNTYNTKLIIE